MAHDPYFCLDRDKIFKLLRSGDDDMIELMLKLNVSLEVRDDVSYKLVAIKRAQVDAKQQTPVQLVDFVSVMVAHKRTVPFSVDAEVLFSHAYVMAFLKRH